MKICVLTSNVGVEVSELKSPVTTMLNRGWSVDHIATEARDVHTVEHVQVEAGKVHVSKTTADASADDYDLMLIPGGTINADTLRLDGAAVSLVKRFVQLGRPIAAICHGPWLLVEANVLPGKTLTSYPSLATDIRNAGATWVDQPTQLCQDNGWSLLTAQGPDNLAEFNDGILRLCHHTERQTPRAS